MVGALNARIHGLHLLLLLLLHLKLMQLSLYLSLFRPSIIQLAMIHPSNHASLKKNNSCLGFRCIFAYLFFSFSSLIRLQEFHSGFFYFFFHFRSLLGIYASQSINQFSGHHQSTNQQKAFRTRESRTHHACHFSSCCNHQITHHHHHKPQIFFSSFFFTHWICSVLIISSSMHHHPSIHMHPCHLARCRWCCSSRG